LDLDFTAEVAFWFDETNFYIEPVDGVG